jgi:hypothetical protein
MTSKTWVPGTVIDSPWLQDVDNLTYKIGSTTDPTAGDTYIGVKTPVTGAVGTTQDQVNSERTSAFQTMTAAQITAISAETGSAAAISSTALQADIDGLALTTIPKGTYQLDVPLRIKNGTPRTNIRGDHRIRSIFRPNAISIATAPANINALFIIQDNNAHFCMSNIRMTSSVAYTGTGVYSVEGGGSDGLGQCLFSGLFENLWIDFSSTNSGFWTGATQNTVFQNITFENMKGAWNIQGVGSGDNFYKNLSFYQCFDQVILQTADTNGSFAMTVDGVHAYNHLRGRLFDVQNWKGGDITNVMLEPDAANLGTTGLFKFKDCVGTQVSNFRSITRAGVPACATGIELDGHTGKFITGAINADIGVKFVGTTAQDVEFVNVDFTNCATASLQINSNFTGTIRTRGCKFNSSQGYNAVFQAVSSNDWYSTDDEFVDAGLGGVAGFRNIALATSGKVVMTRPKIGRTTGSAAAQYWIDATGSGTVDIYDPIFIGTPPSGIISPGSTQAVTIHLTPASGLTTQTGATYTVLDSDCDLIANRAGTVTYTLPAPASYLGRTLFIRTIQNQTAVSASANVVPLAGGAAGTAILAATAGKYARLKSDGTNWLITEAN